MTKEQKLCVSNREWRTLLKDNMPLGTNAIVVSSVGDIKSLRSVASDLNTDKSHDKRYSIKADRDVFQVEIKVEMKTNQ